MNWEFWRCCPEAIRLDPRQRTFYINLGEILRNQGKRQEAIANYEQALRLIPNDREIISRLQELRISPVSSR
ncbi:MAG: tetratricopeptide repeat protein [Thermodesulfobacteriota bacterium]